MDLIIQLLQEKPYDFKRCEKIYTILKDYPLSINQLCKNIIKEIDDQTIMKTFIDLLVVARGSAAIITLNRLTIKSNIVSFIKDEVASIRDMGYIYGYYSDHIENVEYFTYSKLFNRDYHYFDLAFSGPNSILNTPYIQQNINQIVDYILRHNASSYNIFEALCKSDNKKYRPLINEIYDRISPSQKRKYKQVLPVYLDDFKTLNDIIKNKDNISDFNVLMKLIIKLVKQYDLENRIKIIEYFISLPNFIINNRYLEELCFLTDKPYLFIDLYQNRNSGRYLVPGYFYISRIDIEDDYKFLNKYFNIKFDPEFYQYRDPYNKLLYSYKMNVKLLDINNLIIIEMRIFNERVDILSDKLDRNFSTYYAELLYLNLVNDKNYQEKIIEFDNEKNKKNEEYIFEKMIKEMNFIEDNKIKEETFKYDKKAHLEYNFIRKNGEDLLSLKVSNNKRSYIVTSIETFINNFEEHNTYRYGKDLILLHDKNSFVEEDQDFLEIILSNNFNKNSRNIYLNSRLYSNILQSLNNHYINFNDQVYFVNSDGIDIKFKLDQDYKISFKENIDSYFDFGSNIYIINNEEHKFSKIKKKYIELFRFVSQYKNISLFKIKDKFINKIYSLFSDYIEIDESIKDDFISSSLLIDSYIDLDDNDISLKYKFIKNEKEIKNIDDSDKSLFERYKLLLNKIGFNNDFKIVDQDLILNFFKLDLSSLKRFGNIYLSESLKNKKILTFTPPVVKMQYDSNTMKVFIRDSEYSNEELEKVLNAIKHNKKYVLLKNNTILKLDEKSNKFLELIDELSLDKKDLNKEVQIPLYKTLGIDMDENNVECDEHLNKMVSDIKNFKNSDIPLPSINASLRDYQRYGYNWLKILSSYNLGGILGDDMGLGKTLMSITTLVSDEKEEPSLIVAPKSLVFNWMNEFNKFSPSSDVRFIYGSQNERRNMIESIDKNKKVIYLTNYDSLRNDIEIYKNKFNYVFLDEAQYIKNVNALKTINVKKIKSRHRFCLTGTPIENDIFDLWSIFDFLMPSYLPTLTKFKKYGNDINFIESIKRKITPFILRRTKSEVLDDLPPKTEKIISCELNKEQRKLYDATCLKAKTLLDGGSKSFDVLPLLTRLRQICVDPHTFVDDYNGESSKMNLLYETIDDYINKNRRMLVFSQFVSALDIIENHLKEKNIKYFVITGKTSSKNRIKFVEEFNSNEDYKVFLVSLKAGGNGLNLTGADTVIHLDPWWNVAVENQATDRAHRIGQTHNVEVLKLIVEDSVEQRVIELQNKKQELIDALISDDTSLIEKMSIDDLKYILK